MKPHPERIAKGLWWDRAWKMVEGCTPVSPGCENCWSAREAHMRSKQKNEKIREQYAGLTDENGKWNGKIRLLEKNLDLPLRVKKPQVWAVWNDLFHEDVPDDFIQKVVATMAKAKHHIFMLLTKRPQRMLRFRPYWNGGLITPNAPNFLDGKWPRNCWLGVSCENQQAADERIPILLQIPAAVRFVSVEPMLGPVKLPPGWKGARRMPDGIQYYWQQPFIDWVICGGETGPGARPMHPAWVRSLRDQCVTAGVKFWFKQWGEYCAISQMPPETYRAWDIHHGTENCWDENDPRWHVGKKAAGRLLDGQEWSQFPEVQHG